MNCIVFEMEENDTLRFYMDANSIQCEAGRCQFHWVLVARL
jgi:hypothetical protein